MRSQTESLFEASEEAEVEQELTSLFDLTLRLEYELELALRYRE